VVSAPNTLIDFESWVSLTASSALWTSFKRRFQVSHNLGLVGNRLLALLVAGNQLHEFSRGGIPFVMPSSSRLPLAM